MNVNLNLRSTLILIALFLTHLLLHAQNEMVTVYGTMTDNAGNPLPGLAVSIEGTTTGTLTDIDGNYTLEAPLGATLMFSYIGMKTQRAIVTRTGLNPKGTRKIIPYNYSTDASRSKQKLEYQLRQDSLDYQERMKKYRHYLTDADVIRLYERPLKEAFLASDAKSKRQVRRFIENSGQSNFVLGNIIVDTDFSIISSGRQADLQNTFAQGRPLNGELSYRGPETGEYFSWGPSLRNLEFDGIPTSNDVNGSLVKKGLGNGQAANAYQRTALFKTGFGRRLGISSYQTIFGAKTNLTYNNQKNTGILPNEENTIHTLRLKSNFKDQFKLNVSYSNKNEQFKNGLMQARLLSSALLSPISFDNKNGLSRKEALKQSSSIYHPNGSIRSASPGNLDNPYYLAQEATDERKLNSLNYKLAYKASWQTGSLDSDISGELFNSKRQLVFPESSVGMTNSRRNIREEKVQNYFFGSVVSNRLYRHKLSFKLPLRGELYNYQRNLKLDGLVAPEYTQNRQVLTANPYIQYASYNDILVLKAGASAYLSSSSKQSYYRPSFGITLGLFELLDDAFIWDTQAVVERFRLRYNVMTQVNEYNLQMNPGLSNSLLYNSGDFYNYFEDREIMVPETIKPELTTKHDFGVEVSFLNGQIQAETSIYQSNRKNCFFPIADGDQLTLLNVGEIKTHGWEQSIDAKILSGGFNWNTKLSLAQQDAEVIDLYADAPLATSGFNDVHTALIKGKAPSVIRGTAYERNSNGQLVIGHDGFPLVDNALAIVGDSNPDWLMGLSNTFNIKGMSWGFTIDCVLGGDVWNGTQAALDYYGVSNHTASQRHITDYIFNGVKQDGSVNNLAVDFAPRDGDVADNRWVRYDSGGVAEDYIEDASRLILKELYFSYRFPSSKVEHWGLEGLSISLVANNLVTISGYRGNLGSNTLWGHHNTMGLDYFNSPQIRRYSATLSLTF